MTSIPVKAVPFNEDEMPLIDERPVVLFAGIFAPTFDSTFMSKGFEKAGYRVVVMDWQKIKFNSTEEYNTVQFDEAENKYKEVPVKIDGIKVLQDILIKKANQEQPDLIFLHIQSEGILNTLIVDELQRIAPTVIYNFDCRKADKMQWLYDLVPYVELVCFSNLEDVQNCRKLGYKNTAVLQSSADYDHYKSEDAIKKLTNLFTDEFEHEIVFIGNRFDNSNLDFENTVQRTQMVEFLEKEYGDRFKAWGIGFSRMVNQQEEKIIYNRAKIAICQNNFYKVNYQSDRAFRAMGCGVLTIMQQYPEINKDFNPMVASVWLTFDMLKEQIDKHLENDLLRYGKAKAGAEFVRENHSWYNRVCQLQELMKLNTLIKAS